MYGTYNPDIILCLANEQNIWATIQDKIPPLVYMQPLHQLGA